MKKIKKKGKPSRVGGEKTIAGIFAEGTRIDQALTRAGREAIRQHRIAGFDVPVFRNGRTVWIKPDLLEKESR